MDLRILIVAAGVVVSCAQDYDFKPHKYRFETLPRLYDGAAAEALAEKGAVYVTCARFPPDYDFETDPDYDVEAELVLLSDGKEKLALPAGPGAAFSIDPDMHRVRGGSLYTDGVDAGGTFVHKDGERLFRYEGRESMRGFLVMDGKVHTLGQSRSGSGFSYRIDGKLVYGRQDGYILGDMAFPVPEGGALHLDGEDVYFVYGLPFNTSVGTKWEYHLYYKGSDSVVEVPAVVAEVYDIAVHDGVVYRTERRTDKSMNPVLAIGNESFSLGERDYSDCTPHICRIFFHQDEAWVKGYYSRRSSKYFTLWNRRGAPYAIGVPEIYDVWLDGDMRYYIGHKDTTLVVVSRNESFSGTTMEVGSFGLKFNDCARAKDGILRLALFAPADQIVITDGISLQTIPLHGYPTGIWWE